MPTSEEVNRAFPRLRVALQVFLVCVILAGGGGLMMLLESMKKDPPKQEVGEVEHDVAVITVEPDDVPVTILGHGTVRAKNTIQVVPQVSGRVVEVSPRFKAGYRIEKGELLFRLEDDDYRNVRDRAAADKLRLAEQIKMQDTTLAFDRRRLEMAKRSRALAKVEFERAKRLYDEDKIGTLSVVEAAERTLLARENEVIALESAIELHPIRVAELKAQLAAADAQHEQAVLDMKRTTVLAPFDARVDGANVQVGQVLMAGGAMTTAGVLSDLSVLEIPVAIDNTDLTWLPTKEITKQGEYLFREDANVTIRWAQGTRVTTWAGKISRLEDFDSENRTIVLVVEALSPVATTPDRLRLEEGMFCAVSIRGRTAEDVCRVPRGLVTRNGEVPVMHDGRLAMRPVTIARYDGDDALVGEGLEKGDRVVTTPIRSPVVGMKLEARETPPKREDPVEGPSPAEKDDTTPAGGMHESAGSSTSANGRSRE